MPVLFTQKSPFTGVWKITEPWQEMLESLRGNDFYSRNIEKIQSDKRKQEWLAVRLLLKNMSGDEVYIDYKNNGAPVLQGGTSSISISHTMGFAAIILSENQNPGIDIEYHSGRALKLREKYLGEKELEMFDSLRDNLQADNDKLSKLATICWCAKETAYKALQQTEVDFIDHLHIQPFIFSGNGILALKETKTTSRQTFYINYQITEDYVLTWKE